ncbi:MAG: ATP-binding protein [Lachnospiraceae bacterium]|nr:ATP-binding protein [Lachnospiraceae bacterium]
MISYADYVDINMADWPYIDEGEYFTDCLSLLDMFIEESRQIKDRATSKNYYEIPPCLRRTGGESETLGEQITLMCAFMDSRQKKECFPLTRLIRLLGLSLYERLAILAAFAVEYDERYSEIFSEMLGKKTSYPTIGIVNRLYRLLGGECVKEQTELTEPNGCMSSLFFDMSEESGVPVPDRRLCLYEDMSEFLFSGESLEAFVEKLTRDRALTRNEDDIRGADILRPVVDMLEKIRNTAEKCSVILLNGQGVAAKQAVARLLAERKNCGALVINMNFMEGLSAGEKQNYIHKIRFAALGTDVILLSGLSPAKALQPQTGLFVMKLSVQLPSTMILVDIGDEDDRTVRTVLDNPAFAGAQIIRIESPGLDGRERLWRETIGSFEVAEDVDYMEIAEGYELSYDEIINISNGIVRNASLTGETVDRKMIRNAINESCSASFGVLAERLRTDYTWDDICIEASQKKILMMACERYMHRNRVCRDLGIGSKGAYGNGVSVLLYGPPGTGKTMAAQIVANEVGLPLFRVDLSQLSSKYIGETQKNLSKVFDEAAKTNVILFFDEADSVFAKRTDVENSNDKYSNSDSAFLLQKLEGYSGFVILATNLYNNFDNAFVRRITYACSLISPDEATRIAIFRASIPEGAEIDGKLDLDYFGSRFELSGSNIRAIMTSAVYMARIEDVPLSNRHITMSLCYECRKIGKMVPISDLGPYGIYVRETL